MEILVTTDGSTHSLTVLAAAAHLADATGTALVLLRILDPLLDCGDAFAPTVAAAVEQTRERWTGELESLLREAGHHGDALVVVKERNESAARAILRTAAERDASLIAMSTRGSGRLRRAIVGSVAMAVLSGAEQPVVVAGPRVESTAADGSYRLVVTTDGSPGSLAAMQRLSQAFAKPGVQLTLLRICWPGDVDAEDEAELRAIAATLPTDTDVSVVVREMPLIDGAAEGILAVAHELGASAIAMATEGHRGAYHVFSGSIALSVVSRATVPVILTRQTGH